MSIRMLKKNFVNLEVLLLNIYLKALFGHLKYPYTDARYLIVDQGEIAIFFPTFIILYFLLVENWMGF